MRLWYIFLVTLGVVHPLMGCASLSGSSLANNDDYTPPQVLTRHYGVVPDAWYLFFTVSTLSAASTTTKPSDYVPTEILSQQYGDPYEGSLVLGPDRFNTADTILVLNDDLHDDDVETDLPPVNLNMI